MNSRHPRRHAAILLALSSALALAVPTPARAQTQEGAMGMTAVETIDARVLSARERRLLSRVCWVRGEPQGAEWVAEQNPAYRSDVLARYLFERDSDQWRWIPAEAARGGDLRASGYTDRLLEVEPVDGETGVARLEVAGPLREGAVSFRWTLPPERICVLDELALRADVEIETGDPGEQRIGFLLPLSEQLLAEQGPEVKACSPHEATAIDAQTGIERDGGVCRRPLLHLSEGLPWAVWVSLPESFYVVYPYVPVTR